MEWDAVSLYRSYNLFSSPFSLAVANVHANRLSEFNHPLHLRLLRRAPPIAIVLPTVHSELQFDRCSSEREALQAAIAQEPVLILPDSKLPFVVHVDASGFAAGAVLHQDQGRGLLAISRLARGWASVSPHPTSFSIRHISISAWTHRTHPKQQRT